MKLRLLASLAIGLTVLAAPVAADAELDQLRQAAEQGDAEAQEQLGFRYRIGKGVPMDASQAAKWTKLAANQGNAAAQFSLSGMYLMGRGVPKDRVLAHMWANLSASKGYDNAKELRESMAKLLTPDQLAESERLAREWIAAHTGAEDSLTNCYLWFFCN